MRNYFPVIFCRNLALTLGLLVIAAALPAHAQSPSPAAAFDTRTAIRNAFLNNNSSTLPADYSGTNSALAFYAARDFEPAWTSGVAERQMAQLAIAVLANAHQEGLRGEDYEGDFRKPPASQDDIVRYELTLTHAVLKYARDVRLGRSAAERVYKDAAFSFENFPAVAGLASALKNRALTRFFAGLPPPHRQYRQLRQELSRYRAILARGGWDVLAPPPGGVKLDSGDPWLSLLARRLAKEDSRLFPFVVSAEELRAALKRFQARNGIKESGEPDEATLAALNRTVQERILQITANMERWRWLPRSFEAAYIAVNVPDQSAQFVRDGRAIASSKVVVGRKANPTPLTRTEIEAVVVNPPWNIPGFIAARDLLPKLQKNRRYLQSKNMVITDGPEGDPYGLRVDWRGIAPADFPFAIRQLPGPATALGKLMLDSPNDYDVYLHDTPNKDYFALAERGLSNGCVRVENIFTFAALALSDGAQNDDDAELKNVLARKGTERIELKTPLPVYLLYWTAFTGEDGELNFRADTYDRDAALLAVLDGGEAPSFAGDGAESEDIAP
jgi:L,D-transpeptidase YcbB